MLNQFMSGFFSIIIQKILISLWFIVQLAILLDYFYFIFPYIILDRVITLKFKLLVALLMITKFILYFSCLLTCVEILVKISYLRHKVYISIKKKLLGLFKNKINIRNY